MIRKTPIALNSKGDVVFKLSFCPTGPGGGVDPSCSKGEGGKSSDAVKNIRDKIRKVNIQEAAKALAAKGYKLGKGTHDLKSGKTSYEVTKPNGTKVKMTSDEVKALIQKGKDKDAEKGIKNLRKRFKEAAQGDDKLDKQERSAKTTAKTAEKASEKANKSGDAKHHAHAAWKHLVAAKKFRNLMDFKSAKKHEKLADHHDKKTYFKKVDRRKGPRSYQYDPDS